MLSKRGQKASNMTVLQDLTSGNTNSNLESFNNTVKITFTKKQTYYNSGSISKLVTILYYSINKCSFKDYPKYYPDQATKALKLIKLT